MSDKATEAAAAAAAAGPAEAPIVELVVQTGNLTKAPSDGKPGEWAVTKEWKVKVATDLTAESLTEVIATTCAAAKKMWPHEISIYGEDGKQTVLRQSDDTLEQMGIKEGTVLRFWNGKWEI